MSDATVTEKDEENEEKVVTAATGAVSLADETQDELPALLAIAVGVAILAIAVVWPTIANNDDDEDDGSGEVAAVTETTAAVTDGGDTETPAVTATGDAAAAAVQTVSIEASQLAVTVAGKVPDAVTEDALITRAGEIYSPEAVTNELEIDEEVELPLSIGISGTLTDPVLFGQLANGFDTIDGLEVEVANDLVQAESGELEASLNSLEAIQFATGSAVIDSESAAILDEAAAFFIAEPAASAEIGGHTDSTGDAGRNQSLSQARAEAVKTALEARDVTNDLVATGFAARRLKVEPDDNEDAHTENRRIEFRVTS